MSEKVLRFCDDLIGTAASYHAEKARKMMKNYAKDTQELRDELDVDFQPMELPWLIPAAKATKVIATVLVIRKLLKK